MQISFTPNSHKIFEGIIYACNNLKNSSRYFIVKTFFFADKLHLNRYGRPIFGDRYIKMENGPVASYAYSIIKGDDLIEPDILKARSKDLHFPANNWSGIMGLRDSNLDYFSESDLECLDEAIDICSNAEKDEISHITHLDKAWLSAPENREMDYHLLVEEDNPHRKDIIEALEENSALLAF